LGSTRGAGGARAERPGDAGSTPRQWLMANALIMFLTYAGDKPRGAVAPAFRRL